MVLVSDEWQNNIENVPKSSETSSGEMSNETTLSKETTTNTVTTSTLSTEIVKTEVSNTKLNLNATLSTASLSSSSSSLTSLGTTTSSISLPECIIAPDVENTLEADDNNANNISRQNLLENNLENNTIIGAPIQSTNNESMNNCDSNLTISAESDTFISKLQLEENRDEHCDVVKSLDGLLRSGFNDVALNVSDTKKILTNVELNMDTVRDIDETLLQSRDENFFQSIPISKLTTTLNNSITSQILNNAITLSSTSIGLQPHFLNQLSLQKASKQLNTTFLLPDGQNQTGNDSILHDNININSQISTTITNNNNTNSNTCISIATSLALQENNFSAKIVLICETNSHPFQMRTINLTPNVECMVGRLIAKSKSAENNAIFDCKVLSRKHAVIWYTSDGRFWVKDTKSSNGTFINDTKLGDEEAELHFGDIVKFGVDVLENSRKEVHGCIIACVKLYLPDGREAVSIESLSNTHRKSLSNENRISFEELHRLNLYVQETSEREKLITSKLCSIQNILDATRKNSALCWQAMITEDQLLQRIHSLEKKLQFMEKNTPENALRTEVLKLLDDKSIYQQTAKEALRKVYEERCDAIKMLVKVESAYTQSNNECKQLRDQIINSQQVLQEINTRLLSLETEYNEFRIQTASKEREAKEMEDQRIMEMNDKLRERELECGNLKCKISELLIKESELEKDEQGLLEKQAIEKLDAAIADMDFGEDQDYDESMDYENNPVINTIFDDNKMNSQAFKINKTRLDDIDNGIDIEVEKVDNLNLQKSEKITISQNIPKQFKNYTFLKPKTSRQRVKESTVLKWLEISDINKVEGSLDIFKAICNDKENNFINDDDNDDEINGEEEFSYNIYDSTSNFSEKCTNFANKLNDVQRNLQHLEAVFEYKETNPPLSDIEKGVQETEQDKDKESDSEDDNHIHELHHKDNLYDKMLISFRYQKSYELLKSSVNMLRDAYNEMRLNMKEEKIKSASLKSSDNLSDNITIISKNIQKCSVMDTKIMSLHPSECTNQNNQPLQYFLIGDEQMMSQSSLSTNSDNNKIIDNEGHLCLDGKVNDYRSQEQLLSEHVQETGIEVKHYIMQKQCNEMKQTIQDLNRTIKVLNNENISLKQSNRDHNINKIETASTKNINVSHDKKPTILRINNDDSLYQLNDDEISKKNKCQDILKDIDIDNDVEIDREEELIVYKERFEEQEQENIRLRNEIAILLGRNQTFTTKTTFVNLMKHLIPCGALLLAIIVYIINTYF